MLHMFGPLKACIFNIFIWELCLKGKAVNIRSKLKFFYIQMQNSLRTYVTVTCLALVKWLGFVFYASFECGPVSKYFIHLFHCK